MKFALFPGLKYLYRGFTKQSKLFINKYKSSI